MKNNSLLINLACNLYTSSSYPHHFKEALLNTNFNRGNILAMDYLVLDHIMQSKFRHIKPSLQ